MFWNGAEFCKVKWAESIYRTVVKLSYENCIPLLSSSVVPTYLRSRISRLENSQYSTEQRTDIQEADHTDDFSIYFFPASLSGYPMHDKLLWLNNQRCYLKISYGYIFVNTLWILCVRYAGGKQCHVASNNRYYFFWLYNCNDRVF